MNTGKSKTPGWFGGAAAPPSVIRSSDLCAARSIFAKQSMPCESKNAFLAPFPPGSPAGTRGKGVSLDQMEDPFDRWGCATAPLFYLNLTRGLRRFAPPDRRSRSPGNGRPRNPINSRKLLRSPPQAASRSASLQLSSQKKARFPCLFRVNSALLVIFPHLHHGP